MNLFTYSDAVRAIIVREGFDLETAMPHPVNIKAAFKGRNTPAEVAYQTLADRTGNWDYTAKFLAARERANAKRAAR